MSGPVVATTMDTEGTRSPTPRAGALRRPHLLVFVSETLSQRRRSRRARTMLRRHARHDLPRTRNGPPGDRHSKCQGWRRQQLFGVDGVDCPRAIQGAVRLLRTPPVQNPWALIGRRTVVTALEGW